MRVEGEGDLPWTCCEPSVQPVVLVSAPAHCVYGGCG